MPSRRKNRGKFAQARRVLQAIKDGQKIEGQEPIAWAKAKGIIDTVESYAKAADKSDVLEAYRAGEVGLEKIVESSEEDLPHDSPEPEPEAEPEAAGKIADNPDLSAAQSKVADMLRERTTKRESDYTRSGIKETGLSAGYVASRDEDGKTHILKHAYKVTPTIPTDRDRDDRRDLVTEYLTSKLYNRALPKRSPKISLADGDDDNLYLTSKFFDDFQTLTELTGEEKGMNPNHPNLQKIKGFEKVIVGCLFGGEVDYHEENLGVVPVKDAEGNIEHYEAVKIDHGRSGKVYKSEANMRATLAEEYIEYFAYQNIALNVSNIIEAIEQMTNITDDEIEAMVGNGIHELQKNGMDVSDLRTIDGGRTFASDGGKGFSVAEQAFIDGFKSRRGQLQEFAQTLEIVKNIEGVAPDWKNGKWLQDIKGQDPIAWAAENGKKIAGQDPIVWVVENGKLTKEEHTVEIFDVALKNKNKVAVSAMLNSKEVVVHIPSSRLEEILEYAVRNNNLERVEGLVKSPEVIERIHKDKLDDILDIAASYNKSEMVAAIMSSEQAVTKISPKKIQQCFNEAIADNNPEMVAATLSSSKNIKAVLDAAMTAATDGNKVDLTKAKSVIKYVGESLKPSEHITQEHLDLLTKNPEQIARKMLKDHNRMEGAEQLQFTKDSAFKKFIGKKLGTPKAIKTALDMQNGFAKQSSAKTATVVRSGGKAKGAERGV